MLTKTISMPTDPDDGIGAPSRCRLPSSVVPRVERPQVTQTAIRSEKFVTIPATDTITFPSTLNGTTAKREKGPTTAPAGFVISPKYHVGAKKDRDRIGRLFAFHGPSRHNCDKFLRCKTLFSEARSRGFSAGVIISQPKVRGVSGPVVIFTSAASTVRRVLGPAFSA